MFKHVLLICTALATVFAILSFGGLLTVVLYMLYLYGTVGL